jgi:hypothetical protein
MLIFPGLGCTPVFSGAWGSTLATVLVLVAIAIGFIIYLLGAGLKTRETEIFVGGEIAKDHPDMRISGTEFYNTVQELPGLKTFYSSAEKKRLDPYEVGRQWALAVTKPLQRLHNGVLPTYLSWCLLGACALFYVLMR